MLQKASSRLELWLPNGRLVVSWLVVVRDATSVGCIAGLLLLHCQLCESMGLNFLGCVAVHDSNCLGSTDVDTRVIHWGWFYK